MPEKKAASQLDLDQLEAAANAATPGDWIVRSMRGHQSFVQAPRIDPEHPYDIELLGEDESLYPTRNADMTYIVAAQPSAVKELIAEVRALRLAVEASLN